VQVLFPLWPGVPVELQWGALADVAGFGFSCGEASEMNGIAIEPTSVVIAFHWRRVISGCSPRESPRHNSQSSNYTKSR